METAMKIVVFGATGNVGRQVVAEALRRGHQVVGVVRDPTAVKSPDPRVRLIRGDATDALDRERRRRRRGGGECDLTATKRTRSRCPAARRQRHAIIRGLRDAKVKRVLYVGGAGSLEVAPGQKLMDQPGFPDAYKGEAKEGLEALEIWRAEGGGLDWTYLSPAAEIGPGTRTGTYRTTDDHLLVNAAGHSLISFEDYAVAVLDELETPRHVGKRFGVAY
jgi:uncharacterized protein